MKKPLLLLICLLGISMNYAQTFNDGVLEYTVLTGTNVSVNKYNNICPTGNLTIPSTIVDNGTTYTITSIGDYTFYNCSSLASLTIPNSVTSIGNHTFFGCSSLTSLTIPNSITNIGNFTFSGCSGLTSLTIPNSVTSIGNATFSRCSSLTSLTIPNSVTSIGQSTFYNCSGLTSLTIPNSVTSIGDGAFSGCSSLTSVTVNWTTPLVVPFTIFQNVNVSAIPLTVPAGTAALYQAATVWHYFGSFVLSTQDFNENNISIQLFPNPVQDQLSISTNNNLILKEIHIYNNLGQLIKKSNTGTIDVSDLQGVYFAKIMTDKGNVTKKVIIE